MDFEERLQRIGKLDLHAIGTKANEHDGTEVKTYLVNAVAFLNAKGLQGVHPFFDLANACDAIEELSEVRQRLGNMLDTISYPLVRRVVEFYLLSSVIGGSASSIYDPLINVFERGGVIDMQPGELLIDNRWAIPLSDWMKRYSLPPRQETSPK
jgi:hypothetical protein